MAEPQAVLDDAGGSRHTTRDMAILTFLTLLALGPFLTKAYHIDDTLFLKAARHIRAHPLNFFGFDVNWNGIARPMFEITRNPPGVSYFIAGVALLVGWSEPAMHAAFLLPALAVVLGTYRLAGHFCRLPMLAALCTLAAPVFLISSTSVMCDTTMLAFWVWSCELWVQGLGRRSWWRLVAAACLVAAAGLSKYFGLCLIPLLLAYACCLGWAAVRRSVVLLIPVLVMGAYHAWAMHLYGHGLLTDAGKFAVEYHASSRPHQYLRSTWIALSFTGGCVLPVLLYHFRVWRWRTLTCLGLATAAGAVVVLLARPVDINGLYDGGRLNVGYLVQVVVYGASGLAIMVLAAVDPWQRRQPLAIFLALWIWGTFIFAGFVNWEINGRSVLILVPAVAILFATRLSGPPGSPGRPLDRRSLFYWLWPLIPALVLAPVATWADATLADSARLAAQKVGELRPSLPPTSRIWFEGHWGFQYYMEREGFSPVAYDRSVLMPGDRVVIPLNGVNRLALPPTHVAGPKSRDFLVATWVSVSNQRTGAGFYGASVNPLPFVLGPAPPETYYLYAVTQKIDFAASGPWAH